MENLNKLIGERIAKLRKENHMTQAMLAEKLNISVRHCSAIECGNARLSIEKLIEVADLFHVTLDYLILGRRSSNKYIDLFPDSLIQSLQSGTDAELSNIYRCSIKSTLQKKILNKKTGRNIMLLPVFIVYLMPNLLSLPLPFLHNNIHYLKADTPLAFHD